jgi:hypothetical protein
VSLNEKLAVEVMGALKGFRMEARRDEYGNFTQVPTNATYAFPGGRVILQSDWSPTTDLNQLRECYLAAEKDWDTEKQMESFGSRFATVLAVLLAKDAVYESTFAFDVAQIIAWVKHPELVAQAILKAKGVEV